MHFVESLLSSHVSESDITMPGYSVMRLDPKTHKDTGLLLDSLESSYIWSNQIHTIESFKRIVKQRLMDQFIQEWQSRVAENSVCSNYRLFKKKFCFEKYLTYLASILRQRVLKFRLSNHRLPIQQRLPVRYSKG